MQAKRLTALTLTAALFLGMVPAAQAQEPQQSSFPAKFDLRDRGVVTPVRIQDPWASCWSFASIAAAETSILSMLKEKGKAIDPKTFDLSEKHLIWFATNPITEAIDPDQAGEGMFITGAADNSYTNSLYSNGGYGLNTSTLFAAGIGPVLEKYYPYQGDSGLTEKEYLTLHPEAGEADARNTFEEQTGMTPEEFVADPNAESAQSYLRYLRKNGYLTESDNSKLTVEMLVDASLKVYVALFAKDNQYTKLDDWTIPETTTVDGQTILTRNMTSGYTMVDGNKLPSLFLRDENGKWAGIHEEGIQAVKSELMKGHGVSAGFKADVSLPGQEGMETYMSLSNYAHYTYEDKGTSHMICIVGWDDDFAKENFLLGNPPGDGAWLAKNSWGSETDYVTNGNGKDIGWNEWGIKNDDGDTTGFFWISYYDKSLNYCESMTFDTDLSELGGDLAVKMYDYMPSLIGARTGQDTSEQSSTLLKTANVFTNDLNADVGLHSVSTKTAQPNATVKYSVYLLNQGAQDPEDGTLLATKTATYEYAGFHRERLDAPVLLKNGQTFSIVAQETATVQGETVYEYAANISYSKAHAEAVKAQEEENGIDSDDRDRNADEYGVAVVNPGESFIYDNGAWTDWTEYPMRADLLSDYAIDNFSIKAYLVCANTLGVKGGEGSGSYVPGTEVTITANGVLDGVTFDKWTFTPELDSAYYVSADTTASTFTFTMPAQDLEVAASYQYPASFDLRDSGIVTPVKWQNPWGSCWSFGGIAAAETSILTTLGLTTQQYKEKYGVDFDLSEKHLVWYALHPITEATNPAQAGEGLFVTGQEEDPHAVYGAGGEAILVSTLFASGVGPVNEDAFPYQGKEGFTERDFVTKEEYRDRAMAVYQAKAEKALAEIDAGTVTAQEKLKELYDGGYLETDTVPTLQQLTEAYYNKERDYQTAKTYGAFSANDDWTIDQFDGDGHTNRDVYSGYTLIHGNHLPDYALRDEQGHWVGFNPESMAAVKAEMAAGRAVSGAFCADDALPNQETSDKGYMDPTNWAHYTDDEDEVVTHCLCLVGWDDNYPASNFAEGHQPPANGAWIAKNSWGSETEYITLEDGQTIGNKPWGVVNGEGKHTGYFYISYYDKTLSNLETMEFDTDLLDAGGNMSVWAYDYLPSTYNFLKQQETDVIKTANLFPNNSGVAQRLYAVSTKTAYPDASVTYEIYLLGDNAENPEDGVLLGAKTASYAYSGFHREALDGSIVVEDGQRISIVVTETSTDGGETKYNMAASTARAKAAAEAINDAFYGVSRVNPGESFLFRNGQWTDWTESDLLADFNAATENSFVTDNFSIKAYMVSDIYPVTVQNGEGSGYYAAGETVTVTANPAAAGEEFDGWTSGDGVSFANPGSTVTTFTMPAKALTVTANYRSDSSSEDGGGSYSGGGSSSSGGGSSSTPAPAPAETGTSLSDYTDLDGNAWYAEGVSYVLKNGLMKGVGDKLFQPDALTSRAMIVTMLYRLAGEPEFSGSLNFTDVETGSWYTDAVGWAASAGIVNGYSDAAFGPDDTVTREQLAVFLYRFAQTKGETLTGVSSLDFPDADQVSDWAADAIRWAVREKILNGMGDGTLNPGGVATRAQVAAMLARYAGRQ